MSIHILLFAVLGVAFAAAWRRLRLRAAAELDALRARMKTQEDLYLQEKTKVETLLATIPDGIVIANLRGEAQLVNSPAMAVLGIRPEEVRGAGRGLYEIVQPDRLRQMVQGVLLKHSIGKMVEVPLPESDGTSTRHFHVSVTLFSTTGGMEFGILLMLRDVTAERDMVQMKTEFFQAVAHDLRAPLFAIHGYLRLLEKGGAPGLQSQGYIEAIRQSCDKLSLFVQDILDTHRLEAEQLELHLASVDLNAFLERLRTLYAPVAEEKGLRLEIAAPKDGPRCVEGDERMLERVFTNLLSNALKFTPRGGMVRIAASPAGPGHAEFKVEDTGPGIPKDIQGRLFDKYSQPLGRGKGGFGLGLYICRRIVELHRGTLWVESEPGKGSAFVFRIPVRQQEGSLRNKWHDSGTRLGPAQLG